ncbi:MAG: S1/P1 nuclease [Planctomycetia bacterium]|nr:S1/P1 nuclease [Planctomycetia bacterium]
MKIIWLLLMICFPWSVCHGWNDKGHLVIARLAWKELTPNERERIVKILQRHPHYEEFLRARKPDGYSEDEWVFLRAATWSDWVRGGPLSRRKFHMSNAHFINLPLTEPGFTGVVPAPAAHNIISQLHVSKLIARNGNQEDRAIQLCWVFHLVGDIHQPLHCTNYFSSRFPKGDKGGNLAKARIPGRSAIILHEFWDDLLGSSDSLSSVGSMVLEIEQYYLEKKANIDPELSKNRKFEDWARESVEMSRWYVYLNGAFKPVNIEDKPSEKDLPVLPDHYAQNAGKAARYMAAKAGKRLASELREILASH